MTKKFYTQTLLLLTMFMLLIISCTKNVENIKLPGSNPKLVVGCFISPQDSLITLTITRSNPIFGPGHSNINNLPVWDASVVISNGTNSELIPLISHSLPNSNAYWMRYELQTKFFPILAGQTYSLTVSTPKGENVSASCTVPLSNLSSLTVDFTDTISLEKKLTVKWKDIPNELNYYRVFGQMVFVDTSQGDTITQYMHGDNTLFNNHEKDGNELYAKLVGNGSYFGSQWKAKLIAYDIYVFNIGKEYYDYQYSLEHYTQGDPFSEPNPLYTNIKGGLGIFAGYQQLHVRKP